MSTSSDRRPLASRQYRWAAALRDGLLRTSITANQISMLGVLFAALGGGALLLARDEPILLILAALMIQLRLLCNLLDGMVAVEGGRGSPTGALYNEVPDRLEDALLLIGFGYLAGLPEVGYVTASLAVFTAYVRAVGASHGFGQDFRGPMAKPHRMAALTAGCLAAFVEVVAFGTNLAAPAVLVVVCAGTALTALRRLQRIARGLRERAS